MTDEAILRIAAISAVLSIIELQGDDGANIGRNTGSAWSQDHIRMNMGLSYHILLFYPWMWVGH